MIRMVAMKKGGLRYGGSGAPVLAEGAVFHAKSRADAKTLLAFKWAREEVEPAKPAEAAPAPPARPSYYAMDLTAERAAPAKKVVAAKRAYHRRDMTAEDSDS